MEQYKLRMHFSSAFILKFDKITYKILYKSFKENISLIPGQVDVPLFLFNFGRVLLFPGFTLLVPLFPGTLNGPQNWAENCVAGTNSSALPQPCSYDSLKMSGAMSQG